jgi:hypothetical protein
VSVPPKRRRRRSTGAEPAKRVVYVRRRVPGLLIIEGDADTLAAQGHTAFADRVEAIYRPQAADGRVRLRRERLRSLDDVRRLAHAKGDRYDAVLLLAHGSHGGVVLARDVFVDWRVAARVLAGARPAFLLAVCCNAGSATVTDTLFAQLSTLQRIVGSPETMTTKQAELANLELIAAISGNGLPRGYGTAINIFNAAATNGLLFTRTREEWESTTPMQRVLTDAAGSLGKVALREFLRSL